MKARTPICLAVLAIAIPACSSAGSGPSAADQEPTTGIALQSVTASRDVLYGR